MNTAAHLGIDISKAKIDVALTWSGRKRAKVFRNDAEGWRHLIRWLADQADSPVHACLEATGRYGEGVALALHEAGHVVSIVNPAQIKSFARTKLGRNKTDRLDAMLIGEYCRVFSPAPWTPPPRALRGLRDLVRTRDALQASLREWSNRRGAGALAEAADAAMAAIMATLKTQISEIEAAIVEAIAADPLLRTRHALLVSIPGIGTLSAAIILVEMPEPQVLGSARAAAAYAGLNPSHCMSGSSIDRPTRISRIGNATLRRALYFPALSALKHNPLVKALRERLATKAGFKPKQIIVAAMRKLLHLCYGVLKTGERFDPDWSVVGTVAP
jgi:transposase